jgi:hypothetical protein
LSCASSANAAKADENAPGPGNALAIEIAGKTALARSAKTFIDQHMSEIRDDKLRTATADAIDNWHTYIHHEVTGQTGKDVEDPDVESDPDEARAVSEDG